MADGEYSLGLTACGAFVTISMRFTFEIYSLSNPGNFVAVSVPMPITTKIKHPQGVFNFYGGW